MLRPHYGDDPATDPALAILVAPDIAPRAATLPIERARCDHRLVPTMQIADRLYCLNCDPRSYCAARDCPGIPVHGDGIGLYWCEAHKLLAILMTLLEETRYPPLLLTPEREITSEVGWYHYLTDEQPDRLTVFALLPLVAARKLRPLDSSPVFQL